LDGDNEDKDEEEDDDDDDTTTRLRGRELRNEIPLRMSNHPTPPPSVVAVTPLPTGHKKCKLNDIDPSVTLPDDDDVERLYPHLSRALGERENGFDISNPSLIKSMQALMTELTNFFSTDYELKVKDMAKQDHVIRYVRVPTNSSNCLFLNNKEWLDTTIQISGSKHNGTFEVVYHIANHLIRYYKDSVVAACETQRIPLSCEPMSATAFSAMVHAMKTSGMGERELKKHLRAHLGAGFWATRRDVDMLADGHSEVRSKCINFMFDGKEKAEKIEWKEKDIDKVIAKNLHHHLKSQAISLADVERVQIVVGGDHGDVAFQFGCF